MRVIGGSLRGRRLAAPRGQATRPTGARVREALFNVLASLVPGAVVLDLFAGSGALGIEALSRGASHAVLVEQNRQACDALKQNVAALGLGEQTDIVQASASAALGRLAAAGRQFDLVVLDPPYAGDAADRTLGQLAAGPLLRPGAVVAVEHARRSPPREQAGTPAAALVRRRTLTYGDTAISLYHRPEAPDRASAEEDDE